MTWRKEYDAIKAREADILGIPDALRCIDEIYDERGHREEEGR